MHSILKSAAENTFSLGITLGLASYLLYKQK